jgi:hypothetical protein
MRNSLLFSSDICWGPSSISETRVKINNRPGRSLSCRVWLSHVRMYVPGLPDGFFSDQNPNSGIFWRTSEWKVLLNSDHLEYFTDI